MDVLGRIGEIAAPLLQRMTRQPPPAPDERRKTDADGFVHVHPASQAQPDADETTPDIDRWIAEIARFVAGLRQAALRDLTQHSQLG